MSVLEVSPGSSMLVHAAAALLYLHIGAGCMGLVSGTAGQQQVFPASMCNSPLFLYPSW